MTPLVISLARHERKGDSRSSCDQPVAVVRPSYQKRWGVLGVVRHGLLVVRRNGAKRR